MEDDALNNLLVQLGAMIVKLDTNYDKLTEFISEQKEFNKQQVALNTTVSATLARLEAFITRTENNGR